jgi:hypothetical protein
MRPRLKGALLLTLAFVLGGVAGGLGYGVLHARWGWGEPVPGPRGSQRLLRELDRELRLTAEQRRAVEAILRETGQEFGRLREEVGPRFREIRARSRARIREVLDPAQGDRFDAIANRWEERFRRRPGPSPGSPRER